MIKKTILFISVLIFSFAYLRAQESRLEIDTLYHQIDTMQYRFVRYVPENAQYHFQRVKPDSNNTDLLMCVVAAFTSKAPEHVVGTSVSNGKKKNLSNRCRNSILLDNRRGGEDRIYVCKS